MDPDNREKSKALSVKYRWIGIITVLIIVIAYALYTGRPIQDMALNKDGIKVSFVKPTDQKPGPTVYKSDLPETDDQRAAEETDVLIDIPGEGLLSLSQVDNIIVEPGEDDAQNRHLELVRKTLEIGESNIKYEDSDFNGKFTVWITSVDDKDGNLTFSYTTIYRRNNGSIDLAWREAYNKEGIWLTQISPTFKQLLALNDSFEGEVDSPVQLNKPRLKSMGQINQSLQNIKHKLIRGQISPLGILNECFFDGTITEAFIKEVTNEGETVAEEFDITMQAAYSVADFGYSLYQEKEYLGSKIFWEALLILNDHDAYYHNMHGACLEKLKDLQGALKSYQRAVELNPEANDYLKNVKRLRE